MKHEIDATGKKIGRVATEAAHILLGKSNTNFEKHSVADVFVNIKNASKLSIDDKKKKQKEYKRYSGYPGGLKKDSVKKVIDKKGYSELLRIAVSGMLPSNRLKKDRLKRLIVSN